MKDEILEPNEGSETSQEITLTDALVRYNELYNNDTYKDFRIWLSDEHEPIHDICNLLTDSAIELCFIALGGKPTDYYAGKTLTLFALLFDSTGDKERAYAHLLNFASKKVINEVLAKPQETVKIPILGTVTTGYPDYKKLANALRQDMRDASKELLKLRAWLKYADRINFLSLNEDLLKNSLMHIDDALAALDCTDHIKPESGEDATS